jgi:hypothetical protein
MNAQLLSSSILVAAIYMFQAQAYSSVGIVSRPLRSSHSGSAPALTTTRRSTYPFNAIPAGRVADVDDWIRLSSQSLENATGINLLDRMNLETVTQVHESERFAVLSHGTQEDPVYNYFNRGAVLTFLYAEDEIYQLPSRYSAPAGAVRSNRQGLMQNVKEQDVMVFPTAIRISKTGQQFQLQGVVLWNVYSSDGVRVGQTALFDRDLIQMLPVPEDESSNDTDTATAITQ